MNLFALLSIAGCLLAGYPLQDQIIRDDLGRSFFPGPPPQRIVSLAPNITEILYSLGLGEKIVGVTRYCDFPPQAKEKEKIGGLIDPSLEKIQSLRPELIIAFRGNPLRVLNKLVRLGFPVFVLDSGKSLEDLFLTIERIGRITRAEKEAAFLIEVLKERYVSIRRALEAAASTPKVFISLPGQRFWTCGKESYLNDLIANAGGINIACHMPREWLHLNQEQIIQENPEVIVVLASGHKDFARAREWFLKHPHLRNVRAIQEKRVCFLEENIASRFGPRLLDAYFELARLLHPELFLEEE